MQTKVKSILSLVTDRGILQRDILDTDVEIAAYLVVGFLESAWLLMRMNNDYTVDRILDAMSSMTFAGGTAPAKRPAKKTTKKTTK